MAFVAIGHGRPLGSRRDFLWLVAIVATGRKFSEVNCSLLAVIWRSVAGVYGIVKALDARSGTCAVYGMSGRGVYGIDMTPDICKTQAVSFLWTRDPLTSATLYAPRHWPPTQSIAQGVSFHGDNAQRGIWIGKDNASLEEWEWVGGSVEWHMTHTVRIPVRRRGITTSEESLSCCCCCSCRCRCCCWVPVVLYSCCLYFEAKIFE